MLEGLASDLGVDEPDDSLATMLKTPKTIQHDGDDEGVHAAADDAAEIGEGVALGADLLDQISAP